jgi:hypothetical protein
MSQVMPNRQMLATSSRPNCGPVRLVSRERAFETSQKQTIYSVLPSTGSVAGCQRLPIRPVLGCFSEISNDLQPMEALVRGGGGRGTRTTSPCGQRFSSSLVGVVDLVLTRRYASLIRDDASRLYPRRPTTLTSRASSPRPVANDRCWSFGWMGGRLRTGSRIGKL